MYTDSISIMKSELVLLLNTYNYNYIFLTISHRLGRLFLGLFFIRIYENVSSHFGSVMRPIKLIEMVLPNWFNSISRFACLQSHKIDWAQLKCKWSDYDLNCKTKIIRKKKTTKFRLNINKCSNNYLFYFAGEFGRYQGFQYFLHILSALTAGMHMLSLVTVAAIPEHRCFIDGVDTNESAAAWNSSAIMAAIPLRNDGSLDTCSMYSVNRTAVPCQSYVYDRTYYQNTRAMEWNFVCDKRWMIAIAQTLYMLGTLTGALTLGGLADKIGRKKVFYASAVMQLILGVGVAFIPTYIPFLVVRFLYGIFGSAGSYIPGKNRKN